MKIPADFYRTLWFENAIGERVIPDLSTGEAPEQPDSHPYMVSRFPLQLVTEGNYKHGQLSGQVYSGHSSYSADFVLQLVQSGKPLDEAIIFAAEACSRCHDVVLHQITLGLEGFVEGSQEWAEAGVSCEICRDEVTRYIYRDADDISHLTSITPHAMTPEQTAMRHKDSLQRLSLMPISEDRYQQLVKDWGADSVIDL